jgi:hypothetical protein
MPPRKFNAQDQVFISKYRGEPMNIARRDAVVMAANEDGTYKIRTCNMPFVTVTRMPEKHLMSPNEKKQHLASKLPQQTKTEIARLTRLLAESEAQLALSKAGVAHLTRMASAWTAAEREWLAANRDLRTELLVAAAGHSKEREELTRAYGREREDLVNTYDELLRTAKRQRAEEEAAAGAGAKPAGAHAWAGVFTPH